MEQRSRPVPSGRQFHLPLTSTVPPRRENISGCTLPARPVEKIVLTVPSRRQNLPYRPVPPSKPALNVPSRPNFHQPIWRKQLAKNVSLRNDPYQHFNKLTGLRKETPPRTWCARAGSSIYPQISSATNAACNSNSIVTYLVSCRPP